MLPATLLRQKNTKPNPEVILQYIKTKRKKIYFSLQVRLSLLKSISFSFPKITFHYFTGRIIFSSENFVKLDFKDFLRM